MTDKIVSSLRFFLLFGGLLGLIAVLACTQKPSVEGGLDFCYKAVDCPQGFECALNVCRPTPGYKLEPGLPPEPTAADAAVDRGPIDSCDKPWRCIPCTKETEGTICPESFICAQGECRPGCRNDTGCANGQRCDLTDLTCKDCLQASDCTSGQLCQNNTCTACTKDEECAQGQLCLQGACKAADCRTDADCTGGKLCKQNKCSPCADDTECKNQTLCDQTQKICIPGTCRNDTECPSGLLCKQNQCTKCSADADCGTGKLCVNDACVTGDCKEDSDCAAKGQVCKKNVCSACLSKQECGTGKVCDNGTCKSGDCLVKTDCPLEKICQNNTCSPCTANADCGTGLVCDNGSCKLGECVTTADCATNHPGWLCATNRCVPCKSNAECGSGKVCDIGLCKTGDCTKATEATDCQGKLCKNNTCTACQGDTECPPNYVCDVASGGTCKQGNCTKPQDCTSGQVCVNNTCGACTQDTQCPLSGSKCISGVCTIPVSDHNGAKRWADNTYAKDCAAYRFPAAGYLPATTDGVYWLKPAGNPFQAHCNMTHAGGGWTLVLKADGSKTTFKYDTALWTDKKTLNPTSPNLDSTEAKLESFHTVEVQDILLAMREPPSNTVRTLILRKNATSLHNIMNAGKNGRFDIGAGTMAWRGLFKNPSIQWSCGAQGFNLEYTGGKISKVRIGYLGNEQGDCGSPDSFFGFGQADTSKTTTGNYASSDSPDNGSRNTKAFGYIYVRKLIPQGTNVLTKDSDAWRYTDGTYAKDCLAYRIPPAASIVDGIYWIKPDTATSPFKAYCEQEYRGGGWTLLLKARGDSTVFSYDQSRWLDKSTYNAGSLSMSANSAKFPSFGTVPFREILLRFLSPLSNQSYNSMVIQHRASSLYDVLRANTYKPFDVPLGRHMWKVFIGPSGSLQSNCNKEGFNVTGGTNYARARIGIISNDQTDCTSTNSRIGIGLQGSVCSQTDNLSVGNSAHCSPDNSIRDTRSFGTILVR